MHFKQELKNGSQILSNNIYQIFCDTATEYKKYDEIIREAHQKIEDLNDRFDKSLNRNKEVADGEEYY